jgi:hypothetical protein
MEMKSAYILNRKQAALFFIQIIPLLDWKNVAASFQFVFAFKLKRIDTFKMYLKIQSNSYQIWIFD